MRIGLKCGDQKCILVKKKKKTCMKRKTLRFMSFVRRHLNLINKIIEDRKEEKRLDY